MRITRAHLLKNAQNAVAEQLYNNRQIICALLTGSLLWDDFMLGGTADIDLIFIHEDEPVVGREITRINDHIHLDMAHLSQKNFFQTRQLRTNGWLGCIICNDPMLLHDRSHWFDYIQASVCAHFMQPENILLRAQPYLDQARQIWLDLNDNHHSFNPDSLLAYLSCLEKAANTIALLSGSPLTERRFFLQFPERANAVSRSNLIPSLKDLISDQVPDAELWHSWVEAWRQSYLLAGKQTDIPVKLHPCRLPYYEQAADAMFPTQPIAAIWIFLNNWSLAMVHHPVDSEYLETWQDACRFLGFSSANFSSRLYDLDVFLDLIEESLEKWAQNYGLFP